MLPASYGIAETGKSVCPGLVLAAGPAPPPNGIAETIANRSLGEGTLSHRNGVGLSMEKSAAFELERARMFGPAVRTAEVDHRQRLRVSLKQPFQSRTAVGTVLDLPKGPTFLFDPNWPRVGTSERADRSLKCFPYRGAHVFGAAAIVVDHELAAPAAVRDRDGPGRIMRLASLQKRSDLLLE